MPRSGRHFVNKGTRLRYSLFIKAVSENHIKENLEALHVKLHEDDMEAIKNIGIHQRYFVQTWTYKPEEIPENHWYGED